MEEQGSEKEEKMIRPNLTIKFLVEMLQDKGAVAYRFQDADPVKEQYLRFKRRLEDVLLPYKELHTNLQQFTKQLSITLFFGPAPSTKTFSAISPASPSVHDSSAPSPVSSLEEFTGF